MLPVFALLLFAAPSDELVERVRSTFRQYVASLPDFVCRQHTRLTRSSGPGAGSRLDGDFVLELTYADGHERYRLLTVDGDAAPEGAAVDSKMLGATGEFASALDAVLNPDAQAVFTRAGADGRDPLRLVKLHFAVGRDHSRWLLGPQAQVPAAFAGTLWVDEPSGRVHQLEFATTGTPKGSDVARASFLLIYDWAAVGTESHLLPARSILEACATDRSCLRSEADFGGYLKFRANSMFIIPPQ